MTWQKTLWLTLFIMVAVMLLVNFIISRQGIPGSAMKIMGVSSIFPAGNCARIHDPKNGWQGYGFSGNFRFFSRSAQQAWKDFQELLEDNFSRSPLKQDLALFDGGAYILQRERKGYRMFCLFSRKGTNYWADMFSPNSLHFGRQAFERFILNLEIDGQKPSLFVAKQILSLHKRISPFFMQTPAQLLGMMAIICALVMCIVTAANIFSGSCPRRLAMGAEACTSGATLLIRGFGRRRVSACCLCREGDLLVVYRFRRPFLKIDIRNERQNIIWKKKSLCYKNYRVLLNEDDFQNWRSRFFG